MGSCKAQRLQRGGGVSLAVSMEIVSTALEGVIAWSPGVSVGCICVEDVAESATLTACVVGAAETKNDMTTVINASILTTRVTTPTRVFRTEKLRLIANTSCFLRENHTRT